MWLDATGPEVRIYCRQIGASGIEVSREYLTIAKQGTQAQYGDRWMILGALGGLVELVYRLIGDT